MALGESVARAGVKKLVMVTSHGGNSAAMSLVAQDLRAHTRTARGHHGLVALRRAGGIVFRRRSAPRHPWRRGRNIDHAGAISASRCTARRSPISVPRAIAMEEGISLALRASAGAVRLAGAGPSSQRRRRRCHAGLRGERASACSITARTAFCELLAEVDRFDLRRIRRIPEDLTAIPERRFG